ncbi:MAG: SGNH/GDSL hydrolase family protein, partial [bacterium]|nr:SGNH/GDSL hydrolase family protein [bacterium]
MKDFTKNTLVFFTSLLLVALALEGILRAFPVRGAFLFPAVNQDNPCFRALPNRKVTFSKAWDFKIPQIKNVNNDGFVNKSDYIASSPLPLISVVGDSYVEAVQITDSEPFFELLKNRLRNFRVYSLGFSGAGLSQYLAWSRYSKEKYKNQYLIINVVGNDFDESLKKYKWQKGHWHYVKDENGMLFLSLCEYKPKRLIYFFLRNSFLAN